MNEATPPPHCIPVKVSTSLINGVEKGDVVFEGSGGHFDILDAFSTMDFVNFPKAMFCMAGITYTFRYRTSVLQLSVIFSRYL